MEMIKSIFSFSVILVLISAILDIIANILLAKSDGFKKRVIGVFAIGLVGVAFWILSIAVKDLDLAVAYALWGCFGILGTSLSGWIFLGQKMKPTAFLGIAILMLGIVLIRT